MSDYDADQYITKMRERIKKLERDRTIADNLPHPWYGPCDGFAEDGGCKECEEVRQYCLEHNCHIITNKQISAMVNGGMLNSDWEIVAKLGIKRCDHLKASQINGELTEPCPDCNGEGWVRVKSCRVVDEPFAERK